MKDYFKLVVLPSAGVLAVMLVAIAVIYSSVSRDSLDETGHEVDRIAADARAVVIITTDHGEQIMTAEAVLPPSKKWNRTGKRSTGIVAGYDQRQLSEKLLEVMREGLTEDKEILVP